MRSFIHPLVGKIFCHWRSLGVAFLLILVFALFCYHLLQDEVSFNSDQLYCIHFCDDLLNGCNVQGFHLPAAPYIFPDMVLVLVCRLLTTHVAATFLLYALFFYTLLLSVLMAICRRIGFRWNETFIIAGLGVTFLLACHFDPVYRGRGLLLTYPGNHMGCLLMGLAFTAFTLRAVQIGFRGFSSTLMVVACASSCFSDQLLIAQFLAPLCGAVLLLGICRLISFRRSILTLALYGLSILLAMKMRSVFLQLGFVPMRIERKDTIFALPLTDTLQQFFANWRNLSSEQTVSRIVFLFHILSGLAVLVLWLRRSKNYTLPIDSPVSGERNIQRRSLDRSTVLLVALVLLFALLSNACILIVTGSVEPYAVTRYLYTWWFLPFLCLVLWSRLLPGQLIRLVPSSVLLLIVFRVLTFPDQLSSERLVPRYPPLAQALDELVRKHGPLRGFAEFWDARETRYLTHEHVPVVPILPNGSPWFHAFNPNSYLSEDRHDLTPPDYHFVVFPTHKPEVGPDPDQIAARYGKPVEVITVGEYIIWRYESMKHRPLDLFLRAQLAQRVVRQFPYLVPADPIALRTAKRNLTPCEARGNLPLQRGEEACIHFDHAVTGAMIDVSANYCDAYTLVFLRDGRELGRTRVPPVEWTGAEFVYGPPGLQSRLVEVPPRCQRQGFNEARLIPEGNSPRYTLGHLLVFDKWIPYRSKENQQPERYHRYEGEKARSVSTPAIAIVDEPSSSGGHSRQAKASYQGCMAYGPYTMLTPGRYRIDFALKVEDNRSSDVVVTLDSCALRGERILQTRTLRGKDFSHPNQYQTFALELDTQDELDFVEFRVMVSGTTTVAFDYVEVTRRMPETTSEACEP